HKWPETITKLVPKLVVAIQRDGTPEYVKASVDAAASDVTSAAAAGDLWRTIFSKPSDGFATLHDILKENAQPNVVSPFAVPFDPNTDVAQTFQANQSLFTVKLHRQQVDLQKTNWSQTHYVAEALQSLYDDTQYLKLASLFVAYETRMAAVGPTRLDAQQLAEGFSKAVAGTLGLNDSTWINALASMYVDRPFRQTLLAGFRRKILRSLFEADIGAPAGDAFGGLERLSGPSRLSAREELLGEQRREVQNVLLGIIGEGRLRQSPQGPSERRFVQPPGAGRDMMRAVIGDIIRQQTGGAAPAAMTSKMANLRSQASKNFQAHHRHWQNNPIGTKDVERLVTRTDADRLDEAVRRKFFGIRAQPTLAKYLRLIVDVEIDIKPENLGQLENCDLIAAWFSAAAAHTPQALDAELAASPVKADFVAYQCKKGGYFRPCGQKDHRTNTDLPECLSPPIRNGVIDLHADDRFELLTLNLSNNVGALRMQAEQNEGAQRDGTLLDTVSTKLPEQQARGLQLIDHGAMAHMVSGLAVGRVAGKTEPKGDKKNPYFAEDLAIGYRPYIQRWKHGERPVENAGQLANGREWRSLVARTVSIEALRAVEQQKEYRDVRHRDHGLVRVAHKLIGAAGTGTPAATASSDQQMFAWMGASLALSTDLQTTASVGEKTGAREAEEKKWPGQDENTDLALDTTYSFSNKPEDKQPALRTGDSYLLGLAPLYPNGGGPSLADVTRAFNARGVQNGSEQTVVLGGSPAGSVVVPFKFGPPHDTPAPGILVSQDEALAWRKHETPPSKSKSDPVNRGPAEQVERIVLRSASKPAGDKDVARRYLVPPRTTFERAEQAGMFDAVFEAKPPGAFSGYSLHEENGNFITDGESTREPKPTKLNEKPKQERSRPAVLLPRASAHQPRAAYYPDPLARNLRVRFERSGAVPAGFPDDLPLHAFWKDGASPVTAQPIELLIRRWSEGRNGGRVNFGDSKGTIKGAGITRQIDRLALEIAPAEEVNLRVWCVPDGYELLRRRSDLRSSFKSVIRAAAQTAVRGLTFDSALEQYIDDLADGLPPEKAVTKQKDGRYAERKAVDEAFSRAFAALLLQTPDNGINAWMTLSVVHAVEKPLAVPVIPSVMRPRLVDGVRREVPLLAVQPVRVKRNASWEDYAKTLDPTDLLSALDLPSEEEGATTYFVGQIEIDRASTGELRLEASWPDFDPAVAIQPADPTAATKDGPRFKFNPPTRDRPLFHDAIRIPRDRGTNPEGRLDLTFDETGSLRGLNFPFSDTAARELCLRVVATSRFVNDFPASDTDAKPEKDALGRFDVETRPPTDSKRMKELKEEDNNVRLFKLLMPASAAPPLPTVTRLQWITPERLTDFEPGRRICVEKHCYPRLYLGQDWYQACGVNGLFAVVCAPGDLVSDRPYSPTSKPSPVLDPVPLSATEALNAPRLRDIPASALSKDPGADGKPGYLSPIADFVTRWGSDPTVRSTPLTGTITRERFSGFVATLSNVPLPNDSSQKVSLLLYKPEFDGECGEFYVDIGVDPGPAHGPMIQLAVARYQPHTIHPRLHLSSITNLKPFQVAPKRTVEVIMHEDKHIRTIVQGVGYTNRNPEVPESFGMDRKLPPEYASIIRYPLQNVRLIVLDNTKPTSGIQAYNERGRAVESKRMKPQFFHPELIWISEFELPKGTNRYRYGLEFDEIDLHFADEAYEKGAAAGSGIVDRPSRFSLTIDLDRGLFSPSEDSNLRPPIQAYSQLR
ncbi:hypothetical protein, partial [Bradyrhizobium sp. Leo170]|uniref:hypothetical protein n=1 Tax=Bradyrhizobium sp. Leo170 TaxID=1571199 RepID=UPI0010CFDA4B